MITEKQIKVANFIQNFGCVRLEHLQTIRTNTTNIFNKR